MELPSMQELAKSEKEDRYLEAPFNSHCSSEEIRVQRDEEGKD
jgi:hypothetical protein